MRMMQEPPVTIPLESAQADDTSSAVEERIRSKKRAALFAVVLCGVIALAAVLDKGGAPLPRESAQHAAAAQAMYASGYEDVHVAARSAIVLDVTTGATLYEKNAAAQLPIASITKVALVLAIADVFEGPEALTISRAAVERGEGGLGAGQVWRARDLIDYTLIASSNVGAEALAEAADDSLRARFPEAPPGGAALWRMNAIARELGLHETYFLNVTGLDLSETQPGAVSSARDIAQLLSYIARTHTPLFAATTEDAAALFALNAELPEAHNTNAILPEIAGLILGKTGFTDLAGGNLAILFDAGLAHPVAIVVLGSTREGRFHDMRSLMNAARIAIAAPTP